MKNYVDITPLQERHNVPSMVIELKGSKPLKVSEADYAQMVELLGERMEDRIVELSACNDGRRIRVKVIAS
jgi:hypothetical protein